MEINLIISIQATAVFSASNFLSGGVQKSESTHEEPTIYRISYHLTRMHLIGISWGAQKSVCMYNKSGAETGPPRGGRAIMLQRGKNASCNRDVSPLKSRIMHNIFFLLSRRINS